MDLMAQLVHQETEVFQEIRAAVVPLDLLDSRVRRAALECLVHLVLLVSKVP